MLANRKADDGRATVCLGVVSELPPPDWYTDPVDESRYRYWDGTAWTSHRAPRLLKGASEGLRDLGALIRDSFALIRRQWRGCVVAALVLIAGQVASLTLAYRGANKIFMGELDEVLSRLSRPGLQLDSTETTEYLESLNFDFSAWHFLWLGLAILVSWVSVSLSTAIVVLLARADLRGDPASLLTVLRQACKRAPRLLGVQIQVWALPVTLFALAVLTVSTVFLFLLLLLIGGIILLVLTLTVAPLAYVVASAGPRQKSLLCACRLLEGRFFQVLGRMLLVVVMVFLFVLAVNFGLGTLNPMLSRLSLPEFLSICIAAALGIFPIVASAIIYSDLGGVWDNET